MGLHYLINLKTFLETITYFIRCSVPQAAVEVVVALAVFVAAADRRPPPVAVSAEKF